jgi:hypothetical protein
MSVIHCPHKNRISAGRVCLHLLDEKNASYVQRFTGTGLKYDLMCWKCREQVDKIDVALADVCNECFQAIEANGSWEGILGKPDVLTRKSNLRFEHEDITIPELSSYHILNIQPIEGLAGTWLACTSKGSLMEIIPDKHSCCVLAQVPQDALDFDGGELRDTRKAWMRGPACVVRVSRNGELAAVANGYGQKGVVIDLTTGKLILRLLRDQYHEDVSCFPLAFIEQDNRLLIVHGTGWNRLDVSDARTGMLLTERGPTSYKKGETRPEHFLDYFHASLLVSPDQQLVADNGWIWHPIGIVAIWNISRWLRDNVWESENGESKQYLCRRAYYWDGPLCWIDDHRLAVWGYGEDDEWLIPAVRIFDVRSGKQDCWFAGPIGSLVFDDYLFSFDKDEGMSVWDIETGEKLMNDQKFFPKGYHRGAKHFLSLMADGKIRVSHMVQG